MTVAMPVGIQMTKRFQALRSNIYFWQSESETQARIARSFENTVVGSNLLFFAAEKPNFAMPSNYVLIGVSPTYIFDDLVFLDEVDCLVDKSKLFLPVYVLDIDSLDSPESLMRLFPFLKILNQNPIVSVWENGEHVWTEHGTAGKSRMFKVLNE